MDNPPGYLMATAAAVLLSGAALMVMAVVSRAADGRIGVNAAAGIRLPSVMRNEATWRAGHQAARRPILISSIATIGFALASIAFASNAIGYTATLFAAITATLIGTCVSGIAAHWAAVRADTERKT